MRPLLFTLCLITSLAAYSQQEATTKTGQKVNLYDDGTWKYQEEATINTNPFNAVTDSINCDIIFPAKVDKVTGDTSYTSDLLVVSKDEGKTGFGLSVMILDKNTLYFYINAVGGDRCIDEGAKINILFTDGTRTELNSNNKFNCEQSAGMYIGSMFYNRAHAVTLSGKKIDIMRVWTGDKFVEQQFTSEQAETLQSYFKCATELTRDRKTKRN